MIPVVMTGVDLVPPGAAIDEDLKRDLLGARRKMLFVEGTAQSLGKTAGKDAQQNKPTYVSLLGLADAKAQITTLRTQAHDALAGFGAAARRLGEIADWIALRTH